MILYSEDWPKYPEAIADYNTTNESFLKLADVLKGMGKKNYNVFLALHNKMLS